MALPSKLYKRWHRYDAQGNKQIKCFLIGTEPDPIKEEFHSEWKEGAGPHSDQHLERVQLAVSNALKGKPKSQEQKEKISVANKGKPKSEQHKANMRKAKTNTK